MKVYIFDFASSDGGVDYRVVRGETYEDALDKFRCAVPDFKEIFHVFKELY